MANTLNGTTYTNIAETGFAYYLEGLTALRIFSREFSMEARSEGSSVQSSKYRAGKAAQDLTGDLAGDYEAAVGDQTTDAVTVTLDQHDITGFYFTDTEYNRIASGVMGDMIDNHIRTHAFKIADAVLDNVFALITRTNYGAAALATNAADFDLDELSDLRKAAVDAGWKWALNGTASCILNPSYYTALTKDDGVRYKYASAADTMNSGILPNLLGFRTVEAQTLGDNSEYLSGFICTPDALAIAMRPPATQAAADFLDYRILQDPETGASMVYAAVFNRKYRRVDHTFETLHGAAVANTAALKRIVTASGS